MSFNNREHLRSCIEPLASEDSITVTVVDNASTDGSASVVADLRATVIELGANLGFGAGCNVGWQTGRSPYVLFLNPDAQMAPDAALRLAEILERNNGGAVAPRIVRASGELDWSLRRFPAVRSIFGQAVFAHRLFPSASWADEVIREPERYDCEGPCDWASGACLLVRRGSLERLKGFDEGFFMYCEDVDLCRRLWDTGEKVIYTPEVRCTHVGGSSAPRSSLIRTLARSRIRYARKHFGRTRASAYRIGVGVNASTHLLVGRGVRGRIGHAQALIATFK